VGSCDDCAADQACVLYVAQLGPIAHCVQVPDDCSGKPSCACMGAGACTGVFDLCSDTQDGLSCACPVCS